MFHLIRSTCLKAVLSLTIVLGSAPALATWSVIAVDRGTGEIGIAGASCTFDVSGIASVVPGKGAIVVQAASHYYARMQGVQKMEEGAPVKEILNVMKQEQFTPAKQQYGVILLAEGTAPIVDTGSDVKDFKGAKTAEDIAVLGNILVEQAVLEDAFNAFREDKKSSFSTRLINALKAGADAGGDSRCGVQKARSAFISIYSSDTGAITKLSAYGTEPGGRPAVDLLVDKFTKLHK